MNKIYAELLEIILDLFQEIVKENVTDEEIGTAIPYNYRHKLMQEMRKAFPGYRINGDYFRMRLIEDAVDNVWNAYNQKMIVYAKISDFIFELMERKRYIPSCYYGPDEEIFADLLPTPEDSPEKVIEKRKVLDYYLLDLHLGLVRILGYNPGYVELSKIKTIRGFAEAFYRKGKF